VCSRSPDSNATTSPTCDFPNNSRASHVDSKAQVPRCIAPHINMVLHIQVEQLGHSLFLLGCEREVSGTYARCLDENPGFPHEFFGVFGSQFQDLPLQIRQWKVRVVVHTRSKLSTGTGHKVVRLWHQRSADTTRNTFTASTGTPEGAVSKQEHTLRGSISPPANYTA